MAIRSGCKVHLADGELPPGRLDPGPKLALSPLSAEQSGT